jgi:hypothetical protein
LAKVYTRKARAVELLECFLSGKLPEENKNGLCACGCGEPLLDGFDRKNINLTKNHIDFSTRFGNNSWDNFNIMKHGHHISYHKQLRKQTRELGEGINLILSQ